MSEQEREAEEDEGGGTSDTAPMLPRRRPAHQAPVQLSSGWAGSAARGLRTLLLPGQLLSELLLHLLLPATVFLLVLMPAAALIYLGFLCHSRVSGALRGWGRWLGPLGSGVLWKVRALGLGCIFPLQAQPPCPQRCVCPSLGGPSANPSPDDHGRKRAFVPHWG